MKKIYIFTLLTTTTIISTTACMEMQRPRKRSTCEEDAVFPSISPSAVIPIYVNNTPHVAQHATPINNNKYQPLPQQNVPVCEADQPGWHILHRIANTTYKQKEKNNENEVELTPIYKSVNTIIEQEQKQLLQTNSSQPDETIKQELYKRAARIVAAEYDGSKYCQRAINEALVSLIIAMNNAKNSGICEEIMGQFSYKKKEEWIAYKHYTSISLEVDIAPLVPIMFVLLKKYNVTIYQTKEPTPLHFDFSTDANQKLTFFNLTKIGNDILQYPAFFQLYYTLRRAIKEISFDALQTFITYICENNDISQKGYSDGSYKDLKNESYANAYNYLLDEHSLDNLYSLLQIIDKAKELREINSENDLITCINPVNKPVKAQLYGLFKPAYSDENIKNRIILLCKLIEKYNKARDYKITPTIAQYNTYIVKRFIDTPLPESVCNNTYLDETFYAFEEFEQLHKSTDKLIQLTIDQVDEQIKNLKK